MVHTILDSEDPTDYSDMRELVEGVLNPVLARCQLRKKTAIKNPANGMFELPLVMEITATLTGDTGQTLTLSLNPSATEAIPVGDYVFDCFAIWSDREEALLAPEDVRVVNYPTRRLGAPDFPPNVETIVPSFVDEFTTALVD